MIRLVTTAPWDRIQSLVEKQPGKCCVAVAYFGSGASKLLPLKAGSVLVIDMSERAVKSGQTKPSEVSKLLRNGVEVHSVENLHAKVFVVGRRGLVGSTNVSFTSANGLVEALLETSAPEPVRLCKEFVRSLQGEIIDLAHARQMQHLYRPPKFGKGKRKQSVKSTRQPAHAPLWAVPTERITIDEQDQAHAEEGRPKARKRMQYPRASNIDEFYWHGSDFIHRLAAGHMVIQVTEEAGKKMISPQARVLHIEEYRKRRSRSAVVFLEIPKRLRRKSVKSVVAKLGKAAKFLGSLRGPQILRDPAFTHSLLNLWSR
jgi:hypothetical protein